RFADDANIRLAGEERGDMLARQGLIVDDHDTQRRRRHAGTVRTRDPSMRNGRSIVTTVPRGVAGAMSKEKPLPYKWESRSRVPLMPRPLPALVRDAPLRPTPSSRTVRRSTPFC